MSGLARSAVAALLLTLTSCTRAPPPSNVTSAAPAPAPEAAPTMAAPEPDGSGPRNSFIVCPGNPRCPPTGGSQPRGRQD